MESKITISSEVRGLPEGGVANSYVEQNGTRFATQDIVSEGVGYIDTYEDTYEGDPGTIVLNPGDFLLLESPTTYSVERVPLNEGVSLIVSGSTNMTLRTTSTDPLAVKAVIL